MSVESMAIALHHSRARGTAKLVLIGIANHDGDGGAWPSVATLAKYAAASERQVQRALSELEALGEIRRMVRAGGDHSTADHLRPNLYHFRLICPPGCDRSSRHRVKGQTVPIDLFSTGVTPVSPGDVDVTGGVTPVSPKPSTNQDQDIQEETRLIAPARVERSASPDLHRNALASQCRLAPRKRHHYEASGYCTFCGEHRDDHYPKFAAAVNRATGEITDDQAAAL